MNKSLPVRAICTGMLCLMALSAHATLVPILDGQAIYDDQLDISWTTNANIDGIHLWETANSWASALTVAGVGDWRLATVDTNNDGIVADCATATQAECADNELGHLYYYGDGTTKNLGVSAGQPGPFSNVVAGYYWASTDHSLDPASLAWVFDFNAGGQGYNGKASGSGYVWAVQSGNAGATAVPAPASVASLLLGFGFLCLMRLRLPIHAV